MIQRICLYGGLGSGKLTATHYLMWRLKSSGRQAEMSHGREGDQQEDLAGAPSSEA